MAARGLLARLALEMVLSLGPALALSDYANRVEQQQTLKSENFLLRDPPGTSWLSWKHAGDLPAPDPAVATACECLVECFSDPGCFSYIYDTTGCRLLPSRGHPEPEFSSNLSAGQLRYRDGMAGLGDYCQRSDECTFVVENSKCINHTCVCEDDLQATEGECSRLEIAVEIAVVTTDAPGDTTTSRPESGAESSSSSGGSELTSPPPAPNLSTTGGPNLSTTGGPDPSTTGGPDPSTTGGPDPSTTGGPDPSTTGGPDPPTTGGPDPSTIGGPDPSTTGDPDPSTTGGPSLSTTGEPGPSTTGGPNSSTTGGPDLSTTGEPDPSTTGGLDPSTTGGHDPSTTAGPDPSTTGRPDPSTTGGLDPSTTAGPDPSTTGGLDPSTTGSPDPSTTGGPEATTSITTTATTMTTTTPAVEYTASVLLRGGGVSDLTKPWNSACPQDNAVMGAMMDAEGGDKFDNPSEMMCGYLRTQDGSPVPFDGVKQVLVLSGQMKRCGSTKVVIAFFSPTIDNFRLEALLCVDVGIDLADNCNSEEPRPGNELPGSGNACQKPNAVLVGAAINKIHPGLIEKVKCCELPQGYLIGK